MDLSLKQKFEERWAKYFPNAALPIGAFYTDKEPVDLLADSEVVDRCLIGNLARVQDGHAFVYDRKTPGCPGGKRYTGFVQKLRPEFPFFLSCGIPDQLEGERYKQSPELVERFMQEQPPFEAPGRYLVWKRWDHLTAEDEPMLVIFLAPADVIAGLFTLANFDWASPHGVIAPMGSGCATILQYPLMETAQERPRCVLGLFDVSARPSVDPNVLSFTIPMARFETMIDQMDESFLTTSSWRKLSARLP
ncbi:MAG TPA: hypothetical protein DEW46_13640 [Verrucomicrobia bacterium]|jgi:hypothetical protein|nr:hypothetical protein [Verrucomicrobiota bacterium]